MQNISRLSFRTLATLGLFVGLFVFGEDELKWPPIDTMTLAEARTLLDQLNAIKKPSLSFDERFELAESFFPSWGYRERKRLLKLEEKLPKKTEERDRPLVNVAAAAEGFEKELKERLDRIALLIPELRRKILLRFPSDFTSPEKMASLFEEADALSKFTGRAAPRVDAPFKTIVEFIAESEGLLKPQIFERIASLPADLKEKSKFPPPGTQIVNTLQFITILVYLEKCIKSGTRPTPINDSKLSLLRQQYDESHKAVVEADRAVRELTVKVFRDGKANSTQENSMALRNLLIQLESKKKKTQHEFDVLEAKLLPKLPPFLEGNWYVGSYAIREYINQCEIASKRHQDAESGPAASGNPTKRHGEK
jgi:hypothetical protein